MKKIPYLSVIICFSILFSCKNEDKSFEGLWINAQTEADAILLEKFEDNYSATMNGKTYSVKKEDTDYKIQVNEQSFLLSYSENENLILLNGNRYIPIENSLSYLLRGRWKDKWSDSDYYFYLDKNDFTLRHQNENFKVKINKQRGDTTITFYSPKFKSTVGIENPRKKNDTLFTVFYFGEGDMSTHYKSWEPIPIEQARK
ncbi:hypothetical protein ACFQO1_03350 [Jejudonia soesokkakensis]|uniref:Lipoprotein n=1 Tax=Jejudonia soesokkakensis TaxID=1323432 RepID=A0ABW2MSA3_9FLAO